MLIMTRPLLDFEPLAGDQEQCGKQGLRFELIKAKAEALSLMPLSWLCIGEKSN